MPFESSIAAADFIKTFEAPVASVRTATVRVSTLGATAPVYIDALLKPDSPV